MLCSIYRLWAVCDIFPFFLDVCGIFPFILRCCARAVTYRSRHEISCTRELCHYRSHPAIACMYKTHIYVYLFIYVFLPRNVGIMESGSDLSDMWKVCVRGGVSSDSYPRGRIAVGRGRAGLYTPKCFLFNSLFLEPLESLMQNAYGEG